MPEDHSPLKKHSTGWFARLTKAHSDVMRLLSGDVDLCSGQPAILCLLNKEPGISQNEIAQNLSIAEASVTNMVARLEKKGLVMRKSDARKSRVYLTDVGYHRFCEMEALLESFEPIVFKGFTLEEKTKFLFDMERVTENLHNKLKE